MRSPGRGRALALEALLLALAVCLGLVESVLVPPLPVPGLRLGLANLAVVVSLVGLGGTAAVRIGTLRVVIVGLLLGTLFGPLGAMSLAGATASALAMVVVRRFTGERLSAIGYSLIGAAVHVTAQVAIAGVLAASTAPLFLLPVSLALSVPSGLAIGYSARLLLSRIPSRTVSFAS